MNKKSKMRNVLSLYGAFIVVLAAWVYFGIPWFDWAHIPLLFIVGIGSFMVGFSLR